MRWIIRLESICFLFLIVNSFAYAQDGSITDRRDGKTYKTVKIGAQTWMAENLAYETGDSWCYDNRESNCLKMGRIYPESNLRYICPEKWKLPSKEDVETLIIMGKLTQRVFAMRMIIPERRSRQSGEVRATSPA